MSELAARTLFVDALRRHHVRLWPRRTLTVMAAFALIGLAARLALPYALKSAINQRLSEIPAYSGRVDDVDVSVLRGSYTMHHLQLEKRDAEGKRPFLSVDQLDFSLVWDELLHRRVVSEINAQHPRLTFLRAETKETSQLDFDRRWQDVINDLFPIEITHLEITHGEVHYVAPDRKPPVDIFLRELKIVARGLRNRPDLHQGDTAATVLVEGIAPGNGKLTLASELEPLAPEPRFHVQLKVEKMSLPAVNQFLLAYGKVDVSRGDFTGYLEVVARDGRYRGYFKPFFENLEFKSASDSDKSLFARVWEKMVAGLAALVKNKETDQVALRIPFEGDIGATRVQTWQSIRTLFRNGFIQALAEGLDGHPRPKDTADQPATPSDSNAEKRVPEEKK